MPYIEYPATPDRLDTRRLDRTRFPACCLPAAVTAVLLGALLLWFTGQLALIGRPPFHSRIGGAVMVFGLAAAGILYGQYRLLERRGNDCGGGWWWNRLLFRILLIPSLGAGMSLPLCCVWCLALAGQCGFGLALPANPHSNLSGHPRPPASAPTHTAALATVLPYGMSSLYLLAAVRHRLSL